MKNIYIYIRGLGRELNKAIENDFDKKNQKRPKFLENMVDDVA